MILDMIYIYLEILILNNCEKKTFSFFKYIYIYYFVSFIFLNRYVHKWPVLVQRLVSHQLHPSVLNTRLHTMSQLRRQEDMLEREQEAPIGSVFWPQIDQLKWRLAVHPFVLFRRRRLCHCWRRWWVSTQVRSCK